MTALSPLLLLTAALLASGAAAHAGGTGHHHAEPDVSCTCSEARLANGWCHAHDVGYIAGFEVRSADLHEALDAHGHEVDPHRLGCATCAEASPDGYCAEHRRGFVDGLLYFSTLTYELGKGRVRQPAEISCPVCRGHTASHGWCDKCGVGRVGNVEIGNRDDYEVAAREYERLLKAQSAATRCEMCAVSIVYDGECPTCKITYKDGDRVEKPKE